MWNNQRYLDKKRECEQHLATKAKTAFDYMHIYKDAVEQEDYEKCKAITEVLKPLCYDTADTHNHIPCLRVKKKVA